MIYFDANATTIMPKDVIDQMVLWMNKGNPSADYKTAKLSRQMMSQFRKYIAKNCNFNNYPLDIGEDQNTPFDPKKTYQIIFTSCASESNNQMIRSVVDSYKNITNNKPHIIMSSIEHKTSLECVKCLLDNHNIELTLIRPNSQGFIEPSDIEKGIRSNTALISIMNANNETGAIMDITSIGKIAHKYKIPFHTDAVQTFGKFLIDPIKSNVDAFSISFHKLHGPQGMGALIIKRAFIDSFKLCPLICGSQNCGMRGGTENVAGVAGSFEATKYTWKNRNDKNKHLTQMKKYFLNKLATILPCQSFELYKLKPLNFNLFVVVFSPDLKNFLPNTILLSIVKPAPPFVCNADMKKEFENNGIILSIGSACNTSSDKASHVLTAMGADQYIKKGTLRISFLDSVNKNQINTFFDVFQKVVQKYNI